MLLDEKKTITEMQSQNIFWKRKNKGLFSSIILKLSQKISLIFVDLKQIIHP